MNLRALVVVAIFPLLSGLVIACGDDGGTTATTTDTTGTSSTAGTTTGTTGPATTGTSTDAPTTTTSPTTGTSDDTSTSTGTTAGTTTGTTTDATTGMGLDCAAIPMGPFTPEYLGGGYNGSEDLGFDGAGGLALKGGSHA
jgi:hypothetical protein